MNIIDRVKQFKQKRKLKKMDEGEKVDQIIEYAEKDPLKATELIEQIEDSDKKIDAIEGIIDKSDLAPEKVADIVDRRLNFQEQIRAYQNSDIIKDNLTEAQGMELVEPILDAKGIKAYEELYKMCGKKTDFDIANYLSKHARKNYDKEMIQKIIVKQIISNIGQYSDVIHVRELLKPLRSNAEKKEIAGLVKTEVNAKIRRLTEDLDRLQEEIKLVTLSNSDSKKLKQLQTEKKEKEKTLKRLRGFRLIKIDQKVEEAIPKKVEKPKEEKKEKEQKEEELSV